MKKSKINRRGEVCTACCNCNAHSSQTIAKLNRPALKQNAQKKGITLISLVVTIIILLILAGITIGLISGSDGILAKATASVDKTHVESAKEQVTLKIGEYQQEFYEGKYVNQEIDNASEQGDWIFENYGKQTLKVKDYEFTIQLPEGLEKADKEHPYIVTIKKNRKLPGKVTGTLSVDGILRWDENWVADGGSGEENKPNQGGDKPGEGENKPTDETVTGTIKVSNSNKLTKGTEIELDATVESTITKIEFLIGNESMYTENVTNEKNYHKTLNLSDLNRLAELIFYQDYTAHLKVTTQNNIQKEITQTVKNYTVGNEKSLQALATTVNGGISLQGENILQVANIGLTQNHTSIGTASSPFKGNYDGQNQKIENLRINNSDAEQGLFGVAENATLENVVLGNGAIPAGNKVGGLVGQAKNCEIRKIENKGTSITSKNQVSGSISCVNIVQSPQLVTSTAGYSYAGGICGLLENSNMTDCKNQAVVTGSSSAFAVGGIVGYFKSSSAYGVRNCVNQGNTISGYGGVGGICGVVYRKGRNYRLFEWFGCGYSFFKI